MWGNPNYLALDVRPDYRHVELFWCLELEVFAETAWVRGSLGWSWDYRTLARGSALCPRRCAPHYIVLHSIYNSVGKEYAALVAWSVEAT